MTILNFSLNPEALSKLHDALVCLGKFSEAVSVEASHDKLVLNTLNTTKSAYASFTLTGNKFFTKYQYRPVRVNGQGKDNFNCRIYNKALLSVFKGRMYDPMREKDTGVDRCDVSVEDGEGDTKSRFIIKLVCRHGVLKTYRLTFEAVAPMHALFDKDIADNHWSISSRALREFVEHFGVGTEQLDIYSEDGRVSFTSYTEKIMSGNEILKQPLHTTIAVDTLEFGEFSVDEKLHIVISVKDFKAIISHASITNTMVKASYSKPACPLQFSYSDEGVVSEFILMTIGESRAASATPAPNSSRRAAKRPTARQSLEATSSSKSATTSEMAPPPRPAPVSTSATRNRETGRARTSRPTPEPPQPSIQSESLFLPQDDDDRRFDPVNYEEDEEMLLWDTHAEKNPVTMNSTSRLIKSENQSIHRNSGLSGQDSKGEPKAATERLLPTQRLSQVRGMFD